MDIRTARKIADQCRADEFNGSESDAHAAFQRLHKDAYRGDRDAKGRAQAIWTWAGSQ